MGQGDVKLIAGAGAFLGWQGAVGTILMATLLGGLFSIVGLVTRILRRNQFIPFGPFIAAGALITLFLMMKNSQFLTTFLF
jgi:leader peptidase (prepilin peptidase)/N-methyltransferase